MMMMPQFPRVHIKFAIAWFAIAWLMGGCHKSEVQDPLHSRQVTFAVHKSDLPGKTQITSRPHRAEIWLGNPIPLTTEVFAQDDVLYTHAVELPLSVHQIQRFLLLDEQGHIVYAIPRADAHYAPLVSRPVAFTVDASQDSSQQVEVQALPFCSEDYAKFGFDWFVIEQQICFFGDICLTGEPYHIHDFAGSLYEQAPGGLKMDMAAIFQIRAFEDGVPMEGSPFSNESWHGVGEPICMSYTAQPYPGKNHTFELWLLAPGPQADEFTYQHYHTFETNRFGRLLPHHPPVIDFVVGSCVYSASTLVLEWIEY